MLQHTILRFVSFFIVWQDNLCILTRGRENKTAHQNDSRTLNVPQKLNKFRPDPAYTHPVLKGPADENSLTALLENRVDAVLASLLAMSVYPMHVTPFGVLYTCKRRHKLIGKRKRKRKKNRKHNVHNRKNTIQCAQACFRPLLCPTSSLVF